MEGQVSYEIYVRSASVECEIWERVKKASLLFPSIDQESVGNGFMRISVTEEREDITYRDLLLGRLGLVHIITYPNTRNMETQVYIEPHSEGESSFHTEQGLRHCGFPPEIASKIAKEIPSLPKT